MGMGEPKKFNAAATSIEMPVAAAFLIEALAENGAWFE